MVATMPKDSDIQAWPQEGRFGFFLRQALKTRYGGRLPSASVFAADFNLRNTDTPTISAESARKWMRGISMPHPSRMRTLGKWLDLDFNQALGVSARNALPQKEPSVHGHIRGLAGLTQSSSQELMACFEKLNPRQQAVMLSLIAAIVEVGQRLE